MNNEIVEDEFTKINKEEFTDEYGDTTVEIELDELKARTYENGAMVEHFEKQVMGTKALVLHLKPNGIAINLYYT